MNRILLVDLGEREPVVRVHQGLQALLRILGQLLPRTRDEEAVRLLRAPADASRASRSRSAGRAAKLDERPGVIEVDLPAGARVRVDAFVNERALRRVLRALKDLA